MFLKQSEASAQSLVTRHKYSILFPPRGVKYERREREKEKKEGGALPERTRNADSESQLVCHGSA